MQHGKTSRDRRAASRALLAALGGLLSVTSTEAASLVREPRTHVALDRPAPGDPLRGKERMQEMVARVKRWRRRVVRQMLEAKLQAPPPPKDPAPAPDDPVGQWLSLRFTGNLLSSPLPSEGYTITSEFGPRHGRHHDGIDLAALAGTPVRSMARGTVLEAGWRRGYGFNVVIDHGGGIQTRYAHLVESPEVRPGDPVDPGARVGAVGATGRTTGPHLHLEVLRDGRPIDPRSHWDF